jgi:hypothetical protein
MSARVTDRNGLRRLAALMCVVAFCFGPAKLLPLVVALAAGAEGSHAVHLEESLDGETKVVLSHGRSQCPHARFPSNHNDRKAGHHHGVASDVVCLLGGSQNGQADHVARFASGAIAEDGSKAPLVRTHSPAPTQGVSAGAASCFAFSVLLSCTFLERSPGKSAAMASCATVWQRCLRSTCLLI